MLKPLKSSMFTKSYTYDYVKDIAPIDFLIIHFKLYFNCYDFDKIVLTYFFMVS
jgi:hypothetical protein